LVPLVPLSVVLVSDTLPLAVAMAAAKSADVPATVVFVSVMFPLLLPTPMCSSSRWFP
jgi:hypothetical protein